MKLLLLYFFAVPCLWAQQPIFPDAVGHGRLTFGGSGRNLSTPQSTVYRINTISGSTAPITAVGDGTFRTSLRTALTQLGPKTITFETSGEIILGSGIEIGSFTTLAGQTAPSPGINIRVDNLLVRGSHILVQHLRFATSGGHSGGSNKDVIGTPNGFQSHIYYDHISVRWGTDENIANRDVDSMTVAWSITSEALHNPSVRPGEDHSAGMRYGGSGGNDGISVLYDLFAHNNRRAPKFSGFSGPQFAEEINNIIYDYAGHSGSADGSVVVRDWEGLDIINNLFRPGPDFVGDKEVRAQGSISNSIYISGNIGPNWSSPNLPDDWSGVEGSLTSRGLTPVVGRSNVTVFAAVDLMDIILPNVGARPADRDAVDTRIINDVINRTGGIIDDENEVGGFPDIAVNVRVNNVPSNFNEIMPSGYTRLEEWLDSLKQVVEGPLSRITFINIGDYGDNDVQEADVARTLNAFNPDFCFTNGDNRYDSNTMDAAIGQFYGQYFPPISSRNRFFPSPGNHDYGDGGGISEYLDYFDLPGPDVQSSNTSGTERYYDVIVGDIHLFLIDSQGSGRDPDGTQGQWLQAQLAASTSSWKIVVMHHPPWSSSSNHGSTSAMQWPYDAWGADAVFAGHDHTYERIELDEDGDGVDLLYIVNGTGGRSLYGEGSHVAGSKVFYNNDFGGIFGWANRDSILFQFYNRQNMLIDEKLLVEGQVEPPPEPPPPPPPPIAGTHDACDAIISSGECQQFDSGFTGNGYVNTANAIGVFIEWLNISADTAGSFTANIRYANNAADRPASIQINGISQRVISFPPTGGWSIWDTVSFSVDLNLGLNGFRITSTVVGGLASIDKLVIDTTGIVVVPPPPGNIDSLIAIIDSLQLEIDSLEFINGVLNNGITILESQLDSLETLLATEVTRADSLQIKVIIQTERADSLEIQLAIEIIRADSLQFLSDSLQIQVTNLTQEVDSLQIENTLLLQRLEIIHNQTKDLFP